MGQHIETYRKMIEKDPVFSEVSRQMASSCGSSFPEQMTCFLLAPVAVSFAAWVLREAVGRKIDRVYFLARDGWQFYQAARALQKSWKLPVELRYLYCSRYSLRIPCYCLMGEEALGYICLRGMEVSFADMMARAGLDEGEAAAIAGKIGYREDIRKPIPLTQIPKFRERLSQCPLFLEKMQNVSREAYRNAMDYFDREGLLEEGSFAIADSGWTGTTQQVLEQLLASGGRKRPLDGFYFGLYDLPAGVDPLRYHTFYFSPAGNLRRKAEFSNSLFEAVFSAPHGMTVGYREGGTGPVLAAERGLQADEMERQTEWIERYAECYGQKRPAPGQDGGERNGSGQGSPGESAADTSEKDAGFIARLLRLFMSRPDRSEAEVYGNYRFSDDVTEKRTHPLALPMTEDELLSGHILEKFRRLYLKKDLPVRESAWYEGSAKLYSSRAAWHQRHYRRYKELIYLRKGLERKLRK